MARSKEDIERDARRSLAVVLLGTTALVVWVLAPLFKALLLGAVLAIIAWPLHVRVTRLFRGKSALSAGLVVTATAALIVIPIVGIVTYLVGQLRGAQQFVVDAFHSDRFAGLYNRLPDTLRHFLEQFALQRGSMFEQLGTLGTQAIGALGWAASATGVALFTLGMALVAYFLMLLQKEAIVTWIERFSPLKEGETGELLEEFRGVVSAVFRSTFLSAFAQGTAAYFGFLIARVPHAFFFAFATFFVAIIPAGVSSALTLLVALFLWLTGHPGAAIFLGLWGVFVVGMVDNVIKPLAIRGQTVTPMNGGVVFFALIGGLLAFGAIGLLLGPLAVSLFVACLRIWRRDFGSPIETPPPTIPR